ncbi:TetR family transcriptional regulator probably coupled to RND multidrug efflux transporter [Gracilibacillus boraciitolerans JCM 21714]|uniref:TetR family transcriptional regulator probably coupled to RND multidrug efflux transporter n=2 Tax=Gracilibacillus boraciitolerans TaxID=307521 RepID=W4VI40_9BACI|nr:TetR family transcriptional regulator probably coupled to RND multidrug efflux transporter [Gracilibacillus boraciitolerans JCM 21714]
MDSKKKRMIEESIKLFSEKGFHTTSIQEIANKSEVSKGAFYLHFCSKNELLVEIYKYYSNVIIEKISSIKSDTEKPFDQFTEQIAALLSLFKEHKEYLIMHVRDNVNLGDKMDELIYNIHKQAYTWISDQLIHVYGDKVRPYLVDMVIQADGLIGGYFKWIVIHDLTFDPKQLAQYITDKIDLIVQKVITDQQSVIFTYQDLKKFTNPAVHELIQQVKNQIERSGQPEDTEAIQVLEEEWNKTEPKNIIIQSMLERLELNPAVKETIQILKKTAVTIRLRLIKKT